MAVFIRKYQEGGATASETQTPPKKNNKSEEVTLPQFRIGSHNVNLKDYTDALAKNFQAFVDTYEDSWTNSERLEMIREHRLFLQNLQEGNITGMNEDGSFDVVDPSYSGLDFSEGGSGRRYAYYARQIAATAKPKKVSKTEKEKKKFTNQSLLKDFYNHFFGGVENPDYLSFFDLDEVTTNAEGKKVRGVRNRVNALLDFLNKDYMSKYDEADETFGDLDQATLKVDRLRRALADGTLNNEDYAAAASLGLNLRGLLSTDGNISFDSSGKATEASSSAAPQDKVLEALFGGPSDPTQIRKLINDEITQWETNTDPDDYSFQLNLNLETFDTPKLMKSFFGNNLDKYRSSLSALVKNINDNGLSYYWKDSLNLHNYLQTLNDGQYFKSMLDTMVNYRNILGVPSGTDELGNVYYVIPNSFNDKKGTILLYYPGAGLVKANKIWKNSNKEYIQSYFLKKYPVLAQSMGVLQQSAVPLTQGITAAKNGGTLIQKGQYGFSVPQTQTLYTPEELSLLQEMLKIQAEELEKQKLAEMSPAERIKYEQEKKKLAEEEAKLKLALEQYEYLNTPPEKWGEREWTEMGSIAASIASIIDPEPISASALGVTGTLAHAKNLANDKDGFTIWNNGDILHSDAAETGLNLLFDAAGAIPVVGDFGQAYKALRMLKYVGTPVLGALGAMQLPDAYNSVKKWMSEGTSAMTPLDWRNVSNGLAALMGAKNYWQNKYKTRALDAAHGTPRTENYKESVIDFKVGDTTHSVKIGDPQEVKNLREALRKAGRNEEAAADAIRSSKSVKAYANEKGIKIEDILAAQAPSGNWRGRGPEFLRETRGLRTVNKTKTTPAGQDVFTPKNSMDALYDRLYRRGRQWATDPNPGESSILNWVKNLFKDGNPLLAHYNRRYGVSKNAEAETPTTTGQSGTQPKTQQLQPKTEQQSQPKQEKPKEQSAEQPKELKPIITEPKKLATPEEKTAKALENLKEKKENLDKAIGKETKKEAKVEEKETINKEASQKRRATNRASSNIGTKSYWRDLTKRLPKDKAKEVRDYLKSVEKGRLSKDNIDALNKMTKGVQTKFFKSGSKIDRLVEAKRQGGIFYAEEGENTDDWFKKLYKQQALTNWNTTRRRDYAGENLNSNGHYHAGSLDEAAKRNRAYTRAVDSINKDLQDFYDSDYKIYGSSLADYVKGYNENAEKIRQHWQLNLTYGNATAGAHNRLFRRMFLSRSQMASNGTPDYNIGYQYGNTDGGYDIQDIEGSSTWLRRMDRYAKEWDQLSDPEKIMRMHKITTSDGKEGYVFKKANGDIGLLSEDEAKRLLGQGVPLKPAETPQGDNNEGNLEVEIGEDDYGNDLDPRYLGGESGRGSRRDIDWEQYLPAALAWGRMMGDNNATRRRTREWINALQTPLQQTYRFDRLLEGDYANMKAAENAGAAIRSQMNRAQTSNASLASLRQLEGISKAREYELKGKLLDNEAIARSRERSAIEEKGNRERATATANTNRALLASTARDKANANAMADVAIQNNLDNWLMNYVEKPLQERINRRKAYQDYYDYASMGPMTYDFTDDPKMLAMLQEYKDLKASGDSEGASAKLDEIMVYKQATQEQYRRKQLKKFKRLHGLRLHVQWDDPKYYSSMEYDPEEVVYEKGGKVDTSLPRAIIRARSRDNDRLIKLVLEIIKNHKDLNKGLRVTDYSKYINKK